MAFRTGILVAAVMNQISASACPDASATAMMVINIAPKCFQGCPQLCDPMDALVTEYLERGDGALLKDQVCQSKGSFDCMFQPENIDECKKVLEMGSTVRIKLPMSAPQLEQQCVGSDSSAVAMSTPPQTIAFLAKEPKGTMPDTTALEANTTPGATVVETTTATASCTGKNEMVNIAISLAPQCFELCSDMCGMLEVAVAQFGAGPDKAAIQKRVCASREIVGCIYQPSNLGACQPLLDAGSSFGVPRSGSELSRRCSGGAALDMSFGNSLSAAAALLVSAVAAMLSN